MKGKLKKRWCPVRLPFRSRPEMCSALMQSGHGAGEVDEKKVAEALSDVGFTPAMQADRVAALSGGWKMKLALGEPLRTCKSIWPLACDVLLLACFWTFPFYDSAG